MLDFISIATKMSKNGMEVYPKFVIKKSKDLMIRGGDFYAIWVEERGLWSTDEQDAIQLIDAELDIYVREHSLGTGFVNVKYLWDAESGMIDAWHKYCQKQMRDSFNMLDEKIIFANTPVDKNDFASKKLPYALENGSIEYWDKLISTLYDPSERLKIEWAIGCIVSGDSKKIQKFMVLYGAAGTGKSTILNIIEQLFEGYFSVFDARALGSSSNSFALEAFKTNPLVAIQHDGDLSRIEDNTRLNSLVSHELMTVNEKFKSTYSNRFKAFLFMGTNKPVKITDSKSGLIRRLIDVKPSGNLLSSADYVECMQQIKFELGSIAKHCLDIYESNTKLYDDYKPTDMMDSTNHMYNFILENYFTFANSDGISLKKAWDMYIAYVEDSRIGWNINKMIFKSELMTYFNEYHDRVPDSRERHFYKGFKTELFEQNTKDEKDIQVPQGWIELKENQPSQLDIYCSSVPAQYADEKTEAPSMAWDKVTTTLSDIDTHKIHYVRVPENLIVIDFDIKGPNGEKDLNKNIELANRLFPKTYAEVSKSGGGLHLHYIWTGSDPKELKREYDKNIEVKVYSGKSALRRKLTLCNDIPIAPLSTGLEYKEKKPVIAANVINDEQYLINIIKKCLRKEVHGSTTENVSMIKKVLDDAYASGMHYDVSHLYNDINVFASLSTHQSEKCLKMVNEMHFMSDDIADGVQDKNKPIAFFDVEVFPNLFVVCYKLRAKDNPGVDTPVTALINPRPEDIEELINKFNLVGFNNRKYDNHILYARYLGKSIEELYSISQSIVNDGTGFFREAYNLSYTDIYDFSDEKMSLKKFEIKYGIHHQELGLPWDKPVDESMWNLVADYCKNDVIATEVVFEKKYASFVARKILAAITDMTPNDTTNTLTTKFVFGNDRNPQSKFNYRFMGDIPPKENCYTIDEHCNRMSIPDDYSGYNIFSIEDDRPWFRCYEFDKFKRLSTYRGEEVGEGGEVYAEPGMYFYVALLDIASMHPTSIEDEQLFGEYTENFSMIKRMRIHVKHREYDKALALLNTILIRLHGADKAESILTEVSVYFTDDYRDDLAHALKIVINSVYGLTSARFINAFRDPRNEDNIVAKRGALFMINLKHEVQKRGFIVAHIKTDSIKIPNATPDIIKFVMDYGKAYGYSFEHEATYDRMCLVNNAVYIAKYAPKDYCMERYGYIPEKNDEHEKEWTATGTQFQIPYVFKKMFTKEDICFEDVCETKQVKTCMYLRDENDIQFIGKVGQFCPMKTGGKELVSSRVVNGEEKFNSVTGTKGYLWLESEYVREHHLEKDIDYSYYDKLVIDATMDISIYGDIDLFTTAEVLPEVDIVYNPDRGDLMPHPIYEENPFYELQNKSQK